MKRGVFDCCGRVIVWLCYKAPTTAGLDKTVRGRSCFWQGKARVKHSQRFYEDGGRKERKADQRIIHDAAGGREVEVG